MNRKKPKLIFIGGADHSGSTLLGCVLGSNQGSPFKHFHVGVIHAYFKKNHSKYRDPGTSLQTNYGNIWGSLPEKLTYDEAHNYLFQKLQCQSIIDSSKTCKNLEALLRSGYAANFDIVLVLSYRPFQKICKSELSREKSDKSVVRNLREYARLSHLAITNALPVIVIDTEHLVVKSKEYCQALCSELDIDYFENKEKYWLHEHCHLYGSATQRKHINNPNLAFYDTEKATSRSNFESDILHLDDITKIESELREQVNIFERKYNLNIQ